MHKPWAEYDESCLGQNPGSTKVSSVSGGPHGRDRLHPVVVVRTLDKGEVGIAVTQPPMFE